MSVIARRKRPRSDDAGTGIDVLFEEHAPMVLAICRYHLRNPQAAEDAAQEVFLSAHRSLLGGTRPRDAAAWLATIARNQCRHALHTSDVVPLDEARTGTVADPAEILAERADISDVTTAIAALPARQREALVMRELWGLSYEQVAAAMHLSTSAVDSLLSRARRRLSEQFGDIPKVARGALLVPASLREQLSRLIPELDPAVTTATGVASGAGGAATLASIGSVPAVTKAVATGAAAVAIAVPVQVTMRADSGPRTVDRTPVTRTAKPEPVRSRARPAATRPQPTRVVSTRREADSSSNGPGSGTDRSSSGSGSSGSDSGSSGSGSGSGDSGSSSSGSSGSGSGSSGSGSGYYSSSGSGSGSSGSGHSGSGSSGSGSSGSGSSGSGSGYGDSSGSGSSGSGSGDSSGSGSDGEDDSGSGSSGSGSGGSGSG